MVEQMPHGPGQGRGQQPVDAVPGQRLDRLRQGRDIALQNPPRQDSGLGPRVVHLRHPAQSQLLGGGVERPEATRTVVATGGFGEVQADIAQDRGLGRGCQQDLGGADIRIVPQPRGIARHAGIHGPAMRHPGIGGQRHVLARRGGQGAEEAFQPMHPRQQGQPRLRARGKTGGQLAEPHMFDDLRGRQQVALQAGALLEQHRDPRRQRVARDRHPGAARPVLAQHRQLQRRLRRHRLPDPPGDDGAQLLARALRQGDQPGRQVHRRQPEVQGLGDLNTAAQLQPLVQPQLARTAQRIVDPHIHVQRRPQKPALEIGKGDLREIRKPPQQPAAEGWHLDVVDADPDLRPVENDRHIHPACGQGQRGPALAAPVGRGPAPAVDHRQTFRRAQREVVKDPGLVGIVERQVAIGIAVENSAKCKTCLSPRAECQHVGLSCLDGRSGFAPLIAQAAARCNEAGSGPRRKSGA